MEMEMGRSFALQNVCKAVNIFDFGDAPGGKDGQASSECLVCSSSELM